jgi:spore maturation protein CgeB
LKIWESKIVLNNFHYAEIEGVNCKYFEINGIGGFQLCDFKESLTEYSPVDPCKYSFSSAREAMDLITHYLNNTNERLEIAEQQRKYFLLHHTYEHRINELIRVIKDKE